MDVTDFPAPSPKMFPVSPIPTKLTHQALVNTLVQDLEVGNLQATITTLSAYFNRYYKLDSGKLAAEWIYKQFVELSAGRSDIQIEYFEHTWKMPSVIARIQGADVDKTGTRVIVGAHADSVGTTSSARAPGADDDASGISTVLEVFRVLAQSQYTPNRTVEFHAYSAEEAGLLGSQAIAKLYYDMDIVVESMLQLDMTMYQKGQGQPIGLITDYTNSQLTDFTGLLVDGYSTLTAVDSKCGYACSDHASWTKYGYRSAFPFEGPMQDSDPYIHTQNDVISYLTLDRGFQFSQMALGYIVEMSA